MTSVVPWMSGLKQGDAVQIRSSSNTVSVVVLKNNMKL